jgi:3-carboxy-cis,cis-muconate cycloisomerase
LTSTERPSGDRGGADRGGADTGGADGNADFGLLSPQWAATPVARATSDSTILQAMLEVEVALVRAYESLGIAPVGTAELVRGVAAEGPFDVASIAARGRDGGNPVIPLVKDLRAAVTAVDADAARWVHRGATSQDILDTALMLVARRAVEGLLADVDTTVQALAALADGHRRTLMASRTLTQHGVPTVFGLKAAGWLGGVLHASRRLGSVTFPVQWGGAGGTLASFAVIGGPETGIRLAEEIAAVLDLAVAPVPWQTQRAPITGLGDALTTLTDALGTISSDVLVLARPEIAELGEPAEVGRGGSSAMPQKHNPVLSVLIQSAARAAPGLSAELHRSANAVDERPDGAWHVEWQTLRELLRLVGGAAGLAAELLPGLVVHSDAMLENLGLSGPLIVSERLMLEFGPLLGAARIQELVSRAAGDGSFDLGAALRAEPALESVSDARLSGVLDPAAYLGDSELLIDRMLSEVAGESGS